MPAVAYRIEYAGRSIVYSGDLSGEHSTFTSFARDADLLVHDMALPERNLRHGELHAKPSAIGRVAAASKCRRLVLTHIFPELEDELDDAIALVRESYHGDIVVARDLDTIA